MKSFIQTTADGSHTLYVQELNENYHSTNGAIAESMHVFIEAGLNKVSKQEIHLLEIGFGTGLNALLTILVSGNTSKKVFYTGLELFPVDDSIISQLNYPAILGDESRKTYKAIHDSPWNEPVRMNDCFQLKKITADALEYSYKEKFDLVYFDAFSPDVQPEMWTNTLFEKLYNCMNPGALLVTYCAKGSVRRTMQQTGFVAERLPGPKGKREMLRATKPV